MNGAQTRTRSDKTPSFTYSSINKSEFSLLWFSRLNGTDSNTEKKKNLALTLNKPQANRISGYMHPQRDQQMLLGSCKALLLFSETRGFFKSLTITYTYQATLTQDSRSITL
jgi:hypothetical protein